MNMESAWREVLNLPQDIDDLAVMHKVSKVMCLPDIITKRIGRIEGENTAAYLGWKGDLYRAFRTVSFGHGFNKFSSSLSDSLVCNLELCAQRIDSDYSDYSISQKDLDELREEINELIDKTISAELAPNLKNYLLDHLYLLVESIDDYLITGIVGIEGAIDQIIGSSHTKPQTAKDVRESEMGKKFITICGKVYTFLSVFDGATNLVEQAYELIE